MRSKTEVRIKTNKIALQSKADQPRMGILFRSYDLDLDLDLDLDPWPRCSTLTYIDILMM